MAKRKGRKQPSKPQAKKMPWGRWLVTGSGWIAATLVWTLDAPGKVNGFFEQKDKAWTNVAPESVNPLTYPGRWTNDEALAPGENLITDGSPQRDDGSLQLDLQRAEDGTFSGELFAKQLGHSIIPWSRVSVAGSVSLLGSFRGEAWDIVQGRHRTIAYFNLTPVQVAGSRGLHFTADSRYDRFLPTDTILWTTDAEMNGGTPGTEFDKALSNAAKRYSEETQHPPPSAPSSR